MVFVTQVVYIYDDKENIFFQFEDMFIQKLVEHNGRLELRLRPDENSIIQHTIHRPYETQLMVFDTESDWQNFLQDKDLIKFLRSREQSIKTITVILGDDGLG
jgi:hypothetical protein